MAILANRIKTKNHLVELVNFIFFSLKKFFIVALICLSSYLLYFPVQAISKSSLEISGIIMSASSLVSDIIIENVKWLNNGLLYFKNLEAENIKLKLQLAELSKVELLVENTISENNELRKLLKVTDEIQYDYITSRLVGISLTPFSSSAIIEAGSSNNVKLDDLITNQDGLVGKVSSVSNNYSSVMLLSDPNSRVPVITSSSKERGILAKQGDDMKLIYLPEEHNVEVGELIYTSGDGKIYPYGLLVGVVYQISNAGIFVKLSANLNSIEFVHVGSKSQK